MAEPATLYKLIILHMLEHIDFPLSNAQISDFFLDREYTDYFTIQQVIHDLMDSGLVRTENTHNSTRYIICLLYTSLTHSSTLHNESINPLNDQTF